MVKTKSIKFGSQVRADAGAWPGQVLHRRAAGSQQRRRRRRRRRKCRAVAACLRTWICVCKWSASVVKALRDQGIECVEGASVRVRTLGTPW